MGGLRKLGRGFKMVGRGAAYALGFFLEVIHVIGQGFKAFTAIFD